MKRGLLLLVPLAALLAPACTAELEEGCLSGPCRADDLPDAGSSATGAGGGGGAAVDAGPNCDETPTPDTGDFPCEVHAVLVARCHECHQSPPIMGAPFPLLTYEDTKQPYGTKKRWQVMKTAIESGFMPFGKDDLAGDELKTMQDWFAACAPPAEAMGCETK